VATYTLRADGTGTKAQSDQDGGGDPAVQAECMSIATHNGETFSAGDVIMLADDGGDYRAQLNFQSSGSLGNRVVYEAYSGDTPVINGSDLIVTWSDEGSDIWSATVTTEPQQVWMDGTFGDRQEDLISCVNEYDWFWGSNVLYVFAASDPDTRYTTPGVEATQRDRGINTVDKDYIDIDGLTITKCDEWGVFVRQSSNITVKNCTIEWCWEHGLLVWLWATHDTDIIIEDCIARYCASEGLAIQIGETASVENLIFRRNTVYENGRHHYKTVYWDYHHEYTGGIKMWTHEAFPSCVGVEFYDNLCYSNGPAATILDSSQKGNGIWIDNVRGTAESPILIYNNLCYDNHGSGIFVEISNYVDVWSNVAYDCATGSTADTDYAAGGIKVMTRLTHLAENNNIFNNTVYGCHIGIQAATYGEEAACRFNDNTFKNNICADCTIELRVSGGASNDVTYGSGNVYNKNCFGAQSSNFIKWDSTDCSTYVAFIAASSQTDNNIESDPSFTAVGTDDYSLAAGSPCIGAGENLGSPYNAALLPSSTWPDGVVTGSQDDY